MIKNASPMMKKRAPADEFNASIAEDKAILKGFLENCILKEEEEALAKLRYDKAQAQREEEVQDILKASSYVARKVASGIDKRKRSVRKMNFDLLKKG